ncbi:hypothetical protein CYY_004028 [Polysphondylium violaceum]|uniref:EF-hand domain-containing protein n=1 Tax=Polysphondylium violaceum TaxID=133409 RepID=A0A8J4PV98_9MYCE|nr:hypothetical protein CYY_004028 [Polysphondylium violaceum]
MTYIPASSLQTNNIKSDKEIAKEYADEANKIIASFASNIKQQEAEQDRQQVKQLEKDLENSNITGEKETNKPSSDTTKDDAMDSEDDEEEQENNNEGELIEKATQLFTKALGYDEKCLDAYLGLCYIKGLAGEIQESKSLLDKAESFYPNDERINLMKSLLKEETSSSAHQHTDSCCSKDEGDEFEGVIDIGQKIDIPLLIHNGSVTKKFVYVLREIFDRFDENKDECLNKREIQLFSKAVNNQELDAYSLNSILKNYNSTKKGGLTFLGFVEFYINQTCEDSLETWKDLKTMGYNQELKLMK